MFSKLTLFVSIRLVFIKAVPNLNYLIPAVEDCYNMCDVVQYLFGLPVRPTKVHIRHLWTDLHNILYPEKGVDDKLSASKKVAELSGHTVETHPKNCYYPRYSMLWVIILPPILQKSKSNLWTWHPIVHHVMHILVYLVVVESL